MNEKSIPKTEPVNAYPKSERVAPTTDQVMSSPRKNTMKPTANSEQTITSIPNSMREQLQRAQFLMDQADHAYANGRNDVASIKAHQALTVYNALIARSTEAGLLAVLAEIGNQGYEFQTVEQVDGYTTVERRLFGVSFGQAVIPTRTVTRRNYRGRVY